MHRFINSSNEWYALLKSRLREGNEIIFDHCILPRCCSQHEARIAIEKCNGIYTLYIDCGISCNKNGSQQMLVLFRQWLNSSNIMFFDFNDLRIFLQNLYILY